MASSKKQNLELHYKMFIAEYENVQRNVEICKEKADHIFELVSRQLETPSDMQKSLESYGKALTDLSRLSDILRTFNIQFELDSLSGKSKDSHEEIFTYPQSNLLGLDIGYESECVITYVKDAKNKLFYMTESGNSSYSDCILNMQHYFQNSPKELDTVPADGEVFGLHLEGYMFRVVKENGNSDKFSNFKAYLIDVGEIVTINENMQMYVLPTAYQKFPAQAILCKLEQVTSNKSIDPSEYLTKCLYTKHKFRIMDKDKSLIYVNLQADTNPFRNNSLCDSNNKNGIKNERFPEQLTNPFKRYLCIKTQIDRSQIDFSEKDSKKCVSVKQSVIINEHSIFNNETNSKNIDYVEELHNMNGYINFLERNGTKRDFDDVRLNKNDNELDSATISTVLKPMKSISNFNNVNGVSQMTESIMRPNHFKDVPPPGFNFKLPKNNKLGDSAIRMEQLTDEQRDMLYEEPLNTTNAMKAVMGYDPKDDKRICQFYNSKTESCFKGAHCKMEHVEKIKDGWTRDEAVTTIDIPSKIEYPSNGEFIHIIPTHVINIEHFFAQIITVEGCYQPTLKEMIYKMNSPEIVEKYKRIKTMPVQFELVIAKYNDGFWYRAKVLSIFDDFSLKVFYLDYGNSNVVSIDDVRAWTPRFDYLPFQAITCKVSGVADNRRTSLEAAEQLRKMILNMKIKALVIDNVERLDLKMWDKNGSDVGMTLISKGLAQNKYAGVLKTNQKLPA